MTTREERIEAAVQRILGRAPEHWVEFRVDGPKGFSDTTRIALRSPALRLTDQILILKFSQTAIIKVKRFHDMNCWPSRLFTAQIIRWSPSIEEFNAQP